MMVDPDESTRDSVIAHRKMARRYDVVPFSGHELTWDANIYTKNIFDSLMGHLTVS
jgi:hypothetical protein